MSEHHASVFESPIDEIRDIINRNLFPIFAGMMSGAFFSYHCEPSAAEDYVRLKQLLQIDRGIEASSLSALREHENNSPQLYQRMMQELQCQIAINVLRRGGGLHQELFNGLVLLTHVLGSSTPKLDPDALLRFIELVERGDLSFE